jgi:hypothetical protein
MSDYKPGTVAVATVRGVKGVRVFCYEDRSGLLMWDSAGRIEGSVVHTGDDITDIRPLVVLDFRDWTPECPGLIAEWITKKARSDRDCPSTSAALMVAQEIEEQTAPPKPPRIPEPGLWGVVSAHVNGKHGPQATYKWAHAPWGWEAIGSTQATRKWEDLIDPVLVREGVES